MLPPLHFSATLFPPELKIKITSIFQRRQEEKTE
jgi:hypothetical protein